MDSLSPKTKEWVAVLAANQEQIFEDIDSPQAVSLVSKNLSGPRIPGQSQTGTGLESEYCTVYHVTHWDCQTGSPF